MEIDSAGVSGQAAVGFVRRGGETVLILTWPRIAAVLTTLRAHMDESMRRSLTGEETGVCIEREGKEDRSLSDVLYSCRVDSAGQFLSSSCTPKMLRNPPRLL